MHIFIPPKANGNSSWKMQMYWLRAPGSIVFRIKWFILFLAISPKLEDNFVGIIICHTICYWRSIGNYHSGIIKK